MVALGNSGFLHGDGVFTSLRIYQGQAPHLNDHWARLVAHGRELGLAPDHTFAEIQSIISQLVQRNALQGQDARLRISLSRQAQAPFLTLAPSPLSSLIPRWQEDGIGVITLGPPYQRHFRPHLKTLNYLPSMMALNKAAPFHCADAIIHDHQDHVVEGAISNVFLVKAGTFFTPADDGKILAGLTRSRVLRLLEKENEDCIEGAISRDTLREADEVFLTNSIREIIPVVSCDKRPIGQGKPGPRTRKIQEAYRKGLAL